MPRSGNTDAGESSEEINATASVGDRKNRRKHEHANTVENQTEGWVFNKGKRRSRRQRAIAYTRWRMGYGRETNALYEKLVALLH